MPNRKQRVKRVRQSEARRLRNKARAGAMKTVSKRVLAAVREGDAQKARQELALAQKRIDKAAKSRVIHPNNAARRKAALAREVASLS